MFVRFSSRIYEGTVVGVRVEVERQRPTNGVVVA